MVVAACFPGMMVGVRNSPLCLDVCASQCSMLVAVCRQYMDGFLAAVCCFNVRVCLLTLSVVLFHVLHSLLASKATWSGNLCVRPVWSCLPGHYTMHPAKCRQTKGREARLCDTSQPSSTHAAPATVVTAECRQTTTHKQNPGHAYSFPDTRAEAEGCVQQHTTPTATSSTPHRPWLDSQAMLSN